MNEQGGSRPDLPREPSLRRSQGRSQIRWEVRRHRTPWRRFLERFGFTLMAIGVAMLVGVMIARLG